MRLTNCEPVTDNVGGQQIIFENSVARCPAIISASPSVVHLEQLQTVSNGSIVCHISRSQLYVGLLYQAAFKRHMYIRIGCGNRRGKLSYGHPLIQTCIDVLYTYVCIILKTCGAKVTMLVIIISNSKVDCNSIIYISVQKSSPRLMSRECMDCQQSMNLLSMVWIIHQRFELDVYNMLIMEEEERFFRLF